MERLFVNFYINQNLYSLDPIWWDCRLSELFRNSIFNPKNKKEDCCFSTLFPFASDEILKNFNKIKFFEVAAELTVSKTKSDDPDFLKHTKEKFLVFASKYIKDESQK